MQACNSRCGSQRCIGHTVACTTRCLHVHKPGRWQCRCPMVPTVFAQPQLQLKLLLLQQTLW
jgi:hypothetical protein